ncbi:MAG: hypothetical protein ABIA02_03800 [Candidatus Falkowbacteria bacterium]
MDQYNQTNQEPTNREILEANKEILRIVQGIKEDYKEIKEDHQDMLEVINEFSTNMDNKISELKSENNSMKSDINSMKSQMLTKDYLDEKLYDFRGDLIVILRKEDTKVRKLIDILKKKNFLSDEDARIVLSMEPFPQMTV